MMRIVIAIVVVLGVIALWQSAYKVDETELALVTQFGQIKSTVTTPGLHFKTPFVQSVTKMDKRVLRVDVPPASFPDVDSQFLQIDAYVRYKIRPTDQGIRDFRQQLINETDATPVISQIVVAALRDEIGQRTRAQIIGGNIVVNADGSRTVTPIVSSTGVPAREELTQLVTQAVQTRADQQHFGIDIVDVRIKRADFPDSIVESVYTRMRSERQVQAARLRAEGEQQYQTEVADVDRQVEEIAADADKQSNQLRGEGEAQAISILADAGAQDPGFYAFQRSLQAYSNFLKSNSTLVLDTNSPLFQFLQSPNGIAPAPSTATPTPTPTP